MPTAVIKPVSVSGSPSSGVTGTANIYTRNGTGMTVQWVYASGVRTANFNTDATTVLPAGAVISHWKVRYRAARSASVTNVYPHVRYNPSASGLTVSDWVVTNDWTDYTFPDPAGAFPDGFPIGSLNTPADFAVFQIGGDLLTTGGSDERIYIDYFEVEVTYELPGIPNLLFMGELF